MRVVLVLREFYCPSKPIGGAERQALKLAERLIRKGVAVTVVTGQWDWGQPRREWIHDVPVHRHFTAWGMLGIKGIRRFGQYLYLLTLFLYLVRRRNDYDFIHCHSALYGASIVSLVGRWLHKKTLVRAMGSGPWGDIRRMRQERIIFGTGWMVSKLRDVDCLVALNKQVVGELVETGVVPERIVCLPNGVEIGQIVPKADYELGPEIRVTFVGRLHRSKGIDVLLLAFKKVREELHQLSLRLVLLGEGSERRALQAMTRELQIDQAVQFLGHVDDPFSFLGQSDLFVLASRSEGMSNALLEAMAHGLPCVVTDIPGNNGVISDRQNGLLVRPDDATDLARALTLLITEEALRKRLGHEARRTVELEYSLDSVADRYVALYAALLEDGIAAKPSAMEMAG